MKRSAALAVLTCALWIVAHPPRSEAQSNETRAAKSTYLVVYHPGSAWLPGKNTSEQPLREHGRYMLSLYTKGVLKFAGPFTDNTGGAVAFEAESEDAAKQIVASDPAVVSQMFTAELHPWGLVDWERRIKK
jgi:uncharacterized protein YciI